MHTDRAIDPVPKQGTFTDHSGTIEAGNVSQILMPANLNRRYFFVQNNSDEDLWINWSSDATIGQPSHCIPWGHSSVWSDPQAVSTEQINIIGTTLGQEFTAKEL